MKTATIISALALMLWSAPALLAFEKPDQPEKNGRKGGGKGVSGDGADGRIKERDRGFKKLDLNKDGVLSFEEFSQAERLLRLDVEKRRNLFDFLDQNKDGELQESELAPREPRWIEGVMKNFPRLDTNKDGMLDFQEFSKVRLISEKSERERRMLFRRLDTNQDGKLRPDDIRPRKPRPDKMDLDFTKYDVDKSGGLNYEEYSSLPFVGRFPEERRKKHFERIDADGNGEISEEEVRSAHKRRPHRDAEGKPPRDKRGEHPKTKRPE